MLRGIILLLLLGFSYSLSDIAIPVGSNFTLTCPGDPDEDFLFPSYTWTFTSQGGKDVQLNSTEPELQFTPVKLQHTGLYTCVIKGQSSYGLVKIKRRFNLLVQKIPTFFKWWVVIVPEGATALLPCHPVFQPSTNTSSATARWSKGEKQFKELKIMEKSQSTDEEKGNKTVASRISWASGDGWSIEITDIKQEDTDVYRCGVSVGSEMKMVFVELVVEPPPPPRCLNHTQPWEACPDPENRSWKATVSESVTEFSVHLYKKLKGSRYGQNLLVSPISIAGLLSHLLLGARGEMRTQLEKALYLPTDFSCLHLVMKQMREETKESMMMANQMFFNPKHVLGEAFVNQSLEFYETVPEKLTDSGEANVKMINEWVERKTQSKIKKLVDFMDSSSEFVLLNAVYFIGKWKGSFDEKSTSGEFMTLSGKLVSVPILYSSKFTLATTYISKLKSQVAKFPLTGKSSLYVMVPNAATQSALAFLEENLNLKNVEAMVKEVDAVLPVSAEVTLPKTKLTTNVDLATLLRKMGVTGLFESPNLCAMFPGENVVELTDGRHQAYISLTEQGVEAAAASSVSFSRSFNSFSAMQPFVFIIWSEQTACPLFMGRVVYPE
ncbi:plasma protease C1 inhibitor [Pygocentrus nattereri]|uniref:Uncharacterized protein n=1 Tax=Pygocentrus nattereri TaxID=42514 RepID=A0A3B4CN53_PYGNA|nr:plasma protease C1 inhibitor [Pygocentrus nattereri]XP_017541562.1 plasma protease C1 inhibitor [Pygocentrus nattereri]XP_017541563.1 plasma protease C1 inhibitor [Pygocentrus nattereri]XP_037391831.1 plasma protease C1 inhibitor [Pygocentrus nattereri]